MPKAANWKPLKRKTQGCVYWLHDNKCTTPELHGYIGCTTTWPARLWRHRYESDFPGIEIDSTILFQGPIKQCVELEQKLRPTAGIGWNKLPGGYSGRATKGIPRSPEVREKIRAAALARWANPKFRAKQLKVLKRTTWRYDKSGANNPNFGKTTSEAAKQIMRDKIAERGIVGKKNPNYRHGEYCR